MSKIVKTVVSITVLLTVLAAEIFIPIFIWQKRAMRQYYNEFHGMDKTTVDNQYPIKEYFSGLPSWYSVKDNYFSEEWYNDDEKVIDYIFRNTYPYRVKYKYRYSQLSKGARDVYKFKVIQSLCDTDKASGERIIASKGTQKYHSDVECLMNYYGIKFKRGREYIIFPEGNRFVGICFAVGYLDGEYPYIDVYPNGARYDATMFGAETKYVSVDEFISLVEVKSEQLRGTSYVI